MRILFINGQDRKHSTISRDITWRQKVRNTQSYRLQDWKLWSEFFR